MKLGAENVRNVPNSLETEKELRTAWSHALEEVNIAILPMLALSVGLFLLFIELIGGILFKDWSAIRLSLTIYYSEWRNSRNSYLHTLSPQAEKPQRRDSKTQRT